MCHFLNGRFILSFLNRTRACVNELVGCVGMRIILEVWKIHWFITHYWTNSFGQRQNDKTFSFDWYMLNVTNVQPKKCVFSSSFKRYSGKPINTHASIWPFQRDFLTFRLFIELKSSHIYPGGIFKYLYRLEFIVISQ